MKVKYISFPHVALTIITLISTCLCQDEDPPVVDPEPSRTVFVNEYDVDDVATTFSYNAEQTSSTVCETISETITNGDEFSAVLTNWVVQEENTYTLHFFVELDYNDIFAVLYDSSGSSGFSGRIYVTRGLQFVYTNDNPTVFADDLALFIATSGTSYVLSSDCDSPNAATVSVMEVNEDAVCITISVANPLAESCSVAEDFELVFFADEDPPVVDPEPSRTVFSNYYDVDDVATTFSYDAEQTSSTVCETVSQTVSNGDEFSAVLTNWVVQEENTYTLHFFVELDYNDIIVILYDASESDGGARDLSAGVYVTRGLSLVYSSTSPNLFNEELAMLIGITRGYILSTNCESPNAATARMMEVNEDAVCITISVANPLAESCSVAEDFELVFFADEDPPVVDPEPSRTVFVNEYDVDDVATTFSYNAEQTSSTVCETISETITNGDGFSAVLTNWVVQEENTYTLHFFVELDYNDIFAVLYDSSGSSGFSGRIYVTRGLQFVYTNDNPTVFADDLALLITTSGTSYVLSSDCDSPNAATVSVMEVNEGAVCITISVANPLAESCSVAEDFELVFFADDESSSTSSSSLETSEAESSLLSRESTSFVTSDYEESTDTSDEEPSLSSETSDEITSSSSDFEVVTPSSSTSESDGESLSSSDIISSSSLPSSTEPSTSLSASSDYSSIVSSGEDSLSSYSTSDEYTSSSSGGEDEVSSLLTSSSISGVPTAPVITGVYNAEEDTAEWTLTIPGSIGPWESMEVYITRGDMSDIFEFMEVTVYPSGMDNLTYSTVVTPESIDITVSDPVSDDEVVIVEFIADSLSGYQWTALATVIVNTPAMVVKKRDTEEWNLEWTIINEDGIPSSSDQFSESSVLSSSSLSSSSLSSSSLSSESLSSKSSSESSSDDFSELHNTTSTASYDSSILPISTFPVSEELTLSSTIHDVTLTTATLTITRTADILTVITVTSCSDVCSEFKKTTGVAIVTEFVSGVVTSYTTYCPESYIVISEVTNQIIVVTTTVDAEKVTRTIYSPYHRNDEDLGSSDGHMLETLSSITSSDISTGLSTSVTPKGNIDTHYVSGNNLQTTLVEDIETARLVTTAARTIDVVDSSVSIGSELRVSTSTSTSTTVMTIEGSIGSAAYDDADPVIITGSTAVETQNDSELNIQSTSTHEDSSITTHIQDTKTTSGTYGTVSFLTTGDTTKGETESTVSLYASLITVYEGHAMKGSFSLFGAFIFALLLL